MALPLFLLKFSIAFYVRSKSCSQVYKAFPLSSIICLFLTSSAWFLTTSFLYSLTNTIFHSCQTTCSFQNVQFPFFHASVFLLTLAPPWNAFLGSSTWFLPDCGVAEQVGLWVDYQSFNKSGERRWGEQRYLYTYISMWVFLVKFYPENVFCCE